MDNILEKTFTDQKLSREQRGSSVIYFSSQAKLHVSQRDGTLKKPGPTLPPRVRIIILIKSSLLIVR